MTPIAMTIRIGEAVFKNKGIAVRKWLWFTLLAVWGLHVAPCLVLGEGVDLKTGEQEGIPYMTGGISKGERAEMEKRSMDYNLKIILAAKSRAYLANIPVTICNADGKTVMSIRADGPWLYVRLPEGRYTIKASYEGQTREKAIQVDHGLELVMFHWAT